MLAIVAPPGGTFLLGRGGHFRSGTTLFRKKRLTLIQQFLKARMRREYPRLLFAPFRIQPWIFFYLLQKIRPSYPSHARYFILIWPRHIARKADENRADFIFHYSGAHVRISVGRDLFDVSRGHAELI